MTAAMLKHCGLECSVIDLFGDADTHAICHDRVVKVERLSNIPEHRDYISRHEWTLFAGGLESHPQIAQKISKWSKPAFTSLDSILAVTDPQQINRAMIESGVDKYLLKKRPASFPAVRKILSGSGQAKLVNCQLELKHEFADDTAFQSLINGDSVSLIFCSNQQQTELLGGSFQLVESMQWTGSISGLYLTDHETQSATEFAKSLAEITGLTGLFGIDFIRNEEGLWPVDINPRIPASAEVIGCHVIQTHLSAFGIESNCSAEDPALSQGKLVLFNDTHLPITFYRKRISCFPARDEDSLATTSIADIPQEDQIIEPDCPILTVFDHGKDASSVKRNLYRLRKQLMGSLV